MKKVLGIFALGLAMSTAVMGTSSARDLPEGSWQVAERCCKSWTAGICSAWASCTPGGGAVRGERPPRSNDKK